MRISPSERRGPVGQHGLTLVEMLVASTLLLLILLSLMLMFNQTQRAFRTGLRQNDTLETGRAAMDLIAREVEQMAATYRQNVTNVSIRLQSNIDPLVYTPPGNTVILTNVLQRFFFLQNNGGWNGLGFCVLNSSVHTNRLDETNNILVGALYRFTMSRSDFGTNELLDNFEGNPLPMVMSTNVNGPYMRRLIDGVVHFAVIPYDANGHVYVDDFRTNNLLVFSTNDYFDGTYRSAFLDASLPASVDVEIGILEPQAMDQLRPLIADGLAAPIRTYLTNNAGKIHIFRRQIPIRTAVR